MPKDTSARVETSSPDEAEVDWSEADVSDTDWSAQPKAFRRRWRSDSGSGGPLWAIILIAIGIVLLLNNIGLVPWSVWTQLWRFWPVLLILLGLQLILGRAWWSRWLVTLIGLLAVGWVILTVVAAHNQALADWLHQIAPWLSQLSQAFQSQIR